MTSRMIAVMPDWPAKSMSWRDAPSDDTVFCQMRRRDDDGERANGYSYDAVKIFMPAGAKKPVYAPYREHVPPDTTAAIFWLKNRDPAHWRDAWQLERYMCAYGQDQNMDVKRYEKLAEEIMEMCVGYEPVEQR